MAGQQGAHFRVPSEVHARRFDEEAVILHLGAGKYFALDAIGSLIWDELIGGKTPGEAADAVIAAYDVDEATARADVAKLTAELLSEGLLQTCP